MVRSLSGMSALSNSNVSYMNSPLILSNARCERRSHRKRTKKVTVSGLDLAAKANKEAKRSDRLEEKTSDFENEPLASKILETLTNSALPPAVEDLLRCLQAKAAAYHPRTDFLFRVNSNNEEKVDSRLRDESIFNLRFLHKFLNLSPECFAIGVNISDRFLARVKVKPKYMACLATAAYLIAAKLVEAKEDWPTPEKLVSVARCGGSASDLQRMEAIIHSKLGDSSGDTPPLEEAATPLHFLLQLRQYFPTAKSFQRAVGDLEMCMCSVAVYAFSAGQLALCIARRHWQAEPGLLLQLARLCGLSDSDLVLCDAVIDAESRKVQNRTPAPRALVWNLSRRTINSLQKPSAAAQSSLLDTIREDWREDENRGMLD